MKFSLSGGGKTKKGKQTLKPRFTIEQLPAVVQGEVIYEYTLPEYPNVKIVISDDRGVGYYTVVEPGVTDDERSLFSLLMEKLYFGLKPTERIEDPLKYVEKSMYEVAAELEIEDEVKKSADKLLYYIKREVGYGKCEIPFRDTQVEEIEFQGYQTPVSVVHRFFSQYQRMSTNIRFMNEEEAARFAERLSERSGRAVNRANPIIDGVLPEGHRLALTYSNEVSRPGTTWDVRKFPEKPFTIAELITFGALTPLMASYLWVLLEAKRFMFVVGATGSGKTTLLNALLTLLHPQSKIVTIEDTAELNLYQENWVRLFTRPPSYMGTKAIGIDELVRTSLRYRPDVVVVGEVRGAEIAELVQAVATGHGGVTTFHGADSSDVFTRITGLLQEAVAEEFKSLISALIIVRRLQNPVTGKRERKVVEVDEVRYGEGGSTSVFPIFRWDFTQERYIIAEEQSPVSGEAAVDRLIASSAYLGKAAELLGVSLDQLRWALLEREALIRTAVEKGIRDYRAFARMVIDYYYPKGIQQALESVRVAVANGNGTALSGAQTELADAPSEPAEREAGPERGA